jgi:hypothetical protein
VALAAAGVEGGGAGVTAAACCVSSGFGEAPGRRIRKPTTPAASRAATPTPAYNGVLLRDGVGGGGGGSGARGGTVEEAASRRAGTTIVASVSGGTATGAAFMPSARACANADALA